MSNGEVYDTACGCRYTVVYLGGKDGKGWGLLTTEGRARSDRRRTAPMFRHDKAGRFIWTAQEVRAFLRGAKLLPMRLDTVRCDEP